MEDMTMSPWTPEVKISPETPRSPEYIPASPTIQPRSKSPEYIPASPTIQPHPKSPDGYWPKSPTLPSVAAHHPQQMSFRPRRSPSPRDQTTSYHQRPHCQRISKPTSGQQTTTRPTTFRRQKKTTYHSNAHLLTYLNQNHSTSISTKSTSTEQSLPHHPQPTHTTIASSSSTTIATSSAPHGHFHLSHNQQMEYYNLYRQTSFSIAKPVTPKDIIEVEVAPLETSLLNTPVQLAPSVRWEPVWWTEPARDTVQFEESSRDLAS